MRWIAAGLIFCLLAHAAQAQLPTMGVGAGGFGSSGGGRSAPTVILSIAGQALTSNAATVTATGGCASGSKAIAFLADAQGRSSSSITDSKGNTWTWVHDAFSGVNLYGSVWMASITSSLAASDTLTVTYGAGTSSATLLFECIGTATKDATGANHQVQGAQYAPGTTDFTDSGSPPTIASRVFMFLDDEGDFSSATVSDPSGPGWTAAGSAIGSVNFGVKLYYQDVSAGATSTLRWTHTSTVDAGAWWISFN